MRNWQLRGTAAAPTGPTSAPGTAVRVHSQRTCIGTHEKKLLVCATRGAHLQQRGSAGLEGDPNMDVLSGLPRLPLPPLPPFDPSVRAATRSRLAGFAIGATREPCGGTARCPRRGMDHSRLEVLAGHRSVAR
jgi:hypothetical protein